MNKYDGKWQKKKKKKHKASFHSIQDHHQIFIK